MFPCRQNAEPVREKIPVTAVIGAENANKIIILKKER
jgi:hypothetical protein